MEFDLRLISLAAYDVLCGSVSARRPAVLRCASPGDTAEDRARIEREARDELRRAGYTGPQAPTDEVGVVFDIMSRPRLAVDIRLFEWTVADRGEPVLAKWGARVAVRNSRGVVGMVGPAGFRAWSFPAPSLVNEAAAFLPAHEPPARFGGVTVPPDHLGPGAFPARRGLTEPVRRALAGPFVRRAHLCVVVHDQIAGRDRASTGLTLNDTALGRFLVYADRNQIAIVPGGRLTLERKLRELTEPVRTY